MVNAGKYISPCLKSKFRDEKHDGGGYVSAVCFIVFFLSHLSPARLWLRPWIRTPLCLTWSCSMKTSALKGQRLGVWWGWCHEGKGGWRNCKRRIKTSFVWKWHIRKCRKAMQLQYWWKVVHPGRLTWNIIMEVWFRSFFLSFHGWFVGSMLIFQVVATFAQHFALRWRNALMPKTVWRITLSPCVEPLTVNEWMMRRSRGLLTDLRFFLEVDTVWELFGTLFFDVFLPFYGSFWSWYNLKICFFETYCLIHGCFQRQMMFFFLWKSSVVGCESRDVPKQKSWTRCGTEANKKVMNANQNLQSLSITGPCYRGVWLCIAGGLGSPNHQFWDPMILRAVEYFFLETCWDMNWHCFCIFLFVISRFKASLNQDLGGSEGCFPLVGSQSFGWSWRDRRNLCTNSFQVLCSSARWCGWWESDEMIHDELWAASKELARDSLFGMRIKFRNISMIPFAMGIFVAAHFWNLRISVAFDFPT